MSLLELQDKIDQLTIEELRTLVDFMQGETQKRKDNFWLTMLEKNTLFVGAQGTGKTASMVMAAHEIHRLKHSRLKTGPGVATIGPQLGLKKAFGPSVELLYDEFIQQLVKISDAASSSEARNSDATDYDQCKLYERYGVKIYGNILISDEAGNLFGKRRVMSSLGQIVSEFGQTLRHVKATLLIASPRGELDLDDKINVQLHYVARPHVKVLFDEGDNEKKICQVYLHRAGEYDAVAGVVRGTHKRQFQQFPIDAVKGWYATDIPVALSPTLINKFRKAER